MEKNNVVDIPPHDKDKLINKLEQKILELENTEEEELIEKKRRYYASKVERRDDRIKGTVIGSIFIVCFTMLVFISLRNPDIYLIDKETMSFIAHAINAFFLLLIPLIIGSIGAIARIMVSGMPIIKNSTLILSSGLMAMFSWVGIKSEILVSIIAPHMEKQGIEIDQALSNSSTEFYSMTLVAIFVGMFSSNVYIFINQKVEALTNRKQP